MAPILVMLSRIWPVISALLSWRFALSIGKWYALAKALSRLFTEVHNSPNSRPTPRAVLNVIEITQDLLSSGAIDLPGVDENALAVSIEELKGQIEWNT
jgi:hypothetical protein